MRVYQRIFWFTVHAVCGLPFVIIPRLINVEDDKVAFSVTAGGLWRWICVLYTGLVYLWLGDGGFLVWAAGVLMLFGFSRYKSVSIVLRVLVLIPALFLLLNLHTVARSAADADIEENPGPEFLSSVVLDRRATIGMAKQNQDVRLVAVLIGIPPAESEVFVQRFCNNAYTASCYENYGTMIPVRGSSDANKAKAFRASYFGTVRQQFVRTVAGGSMFNMDIYNSVFDVASEIIGSNGCIEMRQLEGNIDNTASGNAVDIGCVDCGALVSGADLMAHNCTGARKDKVMCTACGFLVNPVGHTARCTVRAAHSVSAPAWLGDAEHMVDVRRAVLQAGVEQRALTLVCVLYTSGEAQAKYLRAHMPSHMVIIDGKTLSECNTRQLSNWFEANYYGKIRTMYRQWLHTDLACREFTKVDYAELLTAFE